MRIRHIVILATSIFLLSTLQVHAAEHGTEVERFNMTANEAEAIFNSFHGCEDNTVGVTVRQSLIKSGPEGKEQVAELSIFGSFENICDSNLDKHFYATTTVSRTEFSQDDLQGASLQKSFETPDGYDMNLNIVWKGEGEIKIYDNKIRNDVDIYKMRGKSNVSMRSASTTGTFLINGQDYISGSTNTYGNLSTVYSNVTTLTK
ncbi:hypothetical protein KW785_01220 [Candidatus Parcubacteria bacterium]|nr:hypothetical protein [Candidatus Parcubacteria bacterium]